MTPRLRVVHATTLDYTGEAVASFNEARMTPISTSGQLMLRHELAVSPLARIQRYVDYWGTAVEAFDVHVPHAQLQVTATSIVDTVQRWRPAPGQLFVMYLIGYGLGRFWVEGIRIDAAHRIGGLRLNEWVALATVVISGIVLAWMRRHPIPEPVIGPPLGHGDDDLVDLSTVPDGDGLDPDDGDELDPEDGDGLESAGGVEPDPADGDGVASDPSDVR
jgi:hypothetical protein